MDPVFSRSEIQVAIASVLAAFGRSAAEPQGSATLGQRLADWAERVVEWNQHIDLTAARSLQELVDLLLADAAQVASTLTPGSTRSVVDVGSGAGAPGLGLALLQPELAVTLVEPKAKRVAFLRSVLGALGRADVRVERKRSDELPSQTWDTAISRATLEPPAWLSEGARLSRGRVWVLLAHGEPPASKAMRLVEDRRYVWPLTGVSRRALAYEPIIAS
jgi:16S rRNA (guanine527-N7)-methyltransferase